MAMSFLCGTAVALAKTATCCIISTGMKKIHISKLMPAVEIARGDLSDWSVGFVKAITTSKSGDKETFAGVLAGSGVLITANGLHAILTADHVLKALPKTGPVGLILLSRLGLFDHQFLLQMDYVQKITVARGSDEAAGPDLGLLVLPRSDVARLESRKLFHNLDKRKIKMLAEASADKIGPWIMCGLVGEMTENTTPLAGMSTAIAFKGLCGPVVVTRVRHDEKFDYFSVEVNFGKGRGLPESYGGCSGSGLWRLVLGEKNGALTVEEIHLGGIAYYESAPHGDRKYIECHGCKSIYENVVAAMADSNAE